MPPSWLTAPALALSIRAWPLPLTVRSKLSCTLPMTDRIAGLTCSTARSNSCIPLATQASRKASHHNGIQAIGDQIWVTYTALNKAQGGFVDAFDTGGTLVKHFAVHGPLHSPWGIAQAPSDFGPMSNAILISNNISRGRINACNPQTGQFLGPLRDASGKPIEIDGFWALQFGQGGGPNGAPNQLFFTAGPNNYANGLFGVITLGP